MNAMMGYDALDAAIAADLDQAARDLAALARTRP